MINEKMAKVFEAIKTSRIKLVNNWKEHGAFLDKNSIREQGLISEGMGCVSLLLPIIAMGDIPEVYDKDALKEANEILECSINKINEFINSEGFTAAPFADSEITAELFGNEQGYTDSVTWVVSICAMSRYAVSKGLLTFSKQTSEIILKLYALSLKLLLNSQRDDGTWGFLTDKGSKRSLYFTYSASACLGDVFDYTFAEIQEVEESNENADINIDKDKEAIAYIEANGVPNLAKVLETARRKLSDWLITNALPYLPEIASCKELSPEIAEKLGIWQSSTSSKFGVNYYNLYYTYYIIDLIVLMSADLDYANFAKSNLAEFENIKAKLSETLSPSDYKYYFGNGGASDMFVFDFIEQATHASRYYLASAMRTGNSFWSSTESELPIYWAHNDPDIENTTRSVAANLRNSITEAVITPMALRANAQYTYYISEQTDVNLDKLFENILEDRSSKDSKNCTEGLWDGLYYNLAITERSIEAIVDYYDYLCKYDNSVAQTELQDNTSVKEVPVKSEIDEAIERKIEAVIQEKLKEISFASLQPAQPAKASSLSGDIDPSDLIKPISIALSILTQEIEARINTPVMKGDDTDNAVYFLVNLFSYLERKNKLTKIRDFCSATDKSLSKKELESKAFAVENVLDENMKDLCKRIVGDISREGAKGLDLLALYAKLRIGN